jgi:hypothetical protein
LKEPVSHDLFGKAGPTPPHDVELVKKSGLKLWETFTRKPDGRMLLLVDEKFGVFVNWVDLNNLAEFIREQIFDAEAKNVAEFERKTKTYAINMAAYNKKLAAWKKGKTNKPTKPHEPLAYVPYKPTPEAVEFLVSLLWPSLSHTSIVLFRGLPGWKHGGFHLHRMQLASSELNNLFGIFQTAVL